MITEILVFFANYGIFFIIIISLLNFKNEFKSLIAVGLSLAISYGISAMFYVPRPFVNGNFTPLIPHDASSSFPSRHASAGFAMSASTFNSNTILGLISAAVATLMSIGRIYAGLHSQADIVFGVLIGGGCAIFAYSKFMENLLNRIFKRKTSGQNRKTKK